MLGRIPKKVIQYFKEVRQEMSKVTWPTRQETIRQTTLVIVISLTVALFLGGVDYLLTVLLRQIV